MSPSETGAKTTVTFLGTDAVVPVGGGDTASFVINGKYLVDTGWYATIKMRCYDIDPLQLEYLLLTHCHHDHYIGLPHLLFYLAMCGGERPNRPLLKIVGPAGELERVVHLAQQFLQMERFPVVHYAPELIPLQPGDTWEDPEFTLATCASLHPVPGLCYRFTDRNTGQVVAFTGDTAPAPGLISLLQGASLLVHEASYGAGPAPPENASLHSGAPDAARMAQAAGAHRLALVHCPQQRQEAALQAAQALFPNTIWPADGEVVTVEQGDGG